MKKFVAILSIVLVVSATWLYLRQHYRNKSITAWQLVHKNALLVYESERAIPAWNDFIKLPVWPILSQIPSIDSINLQLKTIDSLTGRSGELETLLRDRPFLVSLNKISPNRLDYVLFIPLDNSDKIKILNDLILKFRNLPGHSFNTRHYENTDVFEIKNKAESSIFTYFFHKNYFVGSFTPYLVEDVVRNAAARYAESFQSAYGPVLNYPTIKGDDGNLYFNPHELPGLVTTFTDPVLAGEFRNLVSFSGPGYFDINFENNRFLFNGTTLASTDTAATFLSTFVDQPPSRLSSFYLMPSNTASLIDFTFANLTDWRRSVDRYWAKTGNPYLKRKTDFLSRYNILEKDFYNYAGHELALVNLETGDAQNTDKLILLQANDTSRLLDFMDNLTQTINKTSGDTLFYEKFGNYKIRQLPLKDFPSFLFGDLFTGFENSFYTLYKNYLVTGNSLKAVESFLGDAEEENTWGKSVSFAQYFDNVQKNANISLFVNLNREYGPLYNSLDKKWKDLFRKYEQLIRQFEILSIQFVNINNTIYCSFALQHRTSTTLIQRPSEFLADQLVAAGSVLAARPYIVTNHLDGSREVLLQDTTGLLYLVSSQGKILWMKPMKHRIRGTVYQIDYFSNGKLQDLLTTGDSLYLIDRNGKDVDHYPVAFGDSLPAEWLNVVDYDNSRRYRFIMADSTGRIYMYDKSGKTLDGWNGLDVKGPLIQAPFHLRVHGRDCIVVVRRNGEINVLNRQGIPYAGFPVNPGPINGPVFVQPGPDFTGTLIFDITSDGVIQQVNLEGRIISKTQLYRPDKNSFFQIVPNLTRDNFIIARQDYNRVSLILRTGEALFDEDLLFSGRLKVQYFSFGVNNDIFAFTDEQQEFTYLYNRDGKLINNQPLESAFEISLTYSESASRYKVYSCYGNQFRISSFFRQ